MMQRLVCANVEAQNAAMLLLMLMVKVGGATTSSPEKDKASYQIDHCSPYDAWYDDAF